jgi:hypothetical protein
MIIVLQLVSFLLLLTKTENNQHKNPLSNKSLLDFTQKDNRRLFKFRKIRIKPSLGKEIVSQRVDNLKRLKMSYKQNWFSLATKSHKMHRSLIMQST